MEGQSGQVDTLKGPQSHSQVLSAGKGWSGGQQRHWPSLPRYSWWGWVMCRESTGNTSKLWAGLCPTASGRRPSVQVTDPPYKLVERKKGSGPSPCCSLERLPDLPKVTRWHPKGQVCNQARVTVSGANLPWTSYFSWARTCDLCLPLGLVRPLKRPLKAGNMASPSWGWARA